MKIFTFSSEFPYGSNTYVLESNGEYAIIDPSAPFQRITEALGVSAADFKYLIVTHAHFDHILCIDEWVDKTGLKATVSEFDALSLRDSYYNCYKIFFQKDNGYYGDYTTVSDGDKLSFGQDFLEFFLTPGHTKGSMIVKFKSALFVGDTVFSGGAVGRTDLPGGNCFQLEHSIKKILSFAPDLDVYPGHGPKTKISKINFD